MRQFWIDQCKQGVAWFIGLFVLAIPCAFKLWALRGDKSIKDGRAIDTWTWKWLRAWYHNPEDGDSGIDALVWQNGKQVPYNPSGSRWLAYKWSALRNSANGLKYKYAVPGEGPLKVVGLTITYGYKIENNKYNVPVLSVRKING